MTNTHHPRRATAGATPFHARGALARAVCLGLLLLVSAGVAAQDPQVIIRTTHGDITLRLFPDQAPITVENFLGYVDSGHYRGTIFHRVVPGFVIQGGGFDESLNRRSTRPPIQNEASNGLSNARGTLAMARTSDPHSATDQFYINLRDNVALDWRSDNPGYAVFGEVIDGMLAVDSIALEPRGNVGGFQNVPLRPVTITDVLRAGDAPPSQPGGDGNSGQLIMRTVESILRGRLLRSDGGSLARGGEAGMARGGDRVGVAME